MTYEYNPQSTRFEIANPHRVENGFLLLAALISAGFGVAALLAARHELAVQFSVRAAPFIVVAAILLSTGVLFAVWALRQLRFFFGRNQPAGLVQELGKDKEGSSGGAEGLRETLRQNAIAYQVPTGALDNLLYALNRDLIFSPPRTQFVARNEFRNVLSLSFLLLCFVVALVSVPPGELRNWISAFYLGLTVFLVLLPMGGETAQAQPLGSRFVIGLFIVSVIGPVLLPRLAGQLPLRWQPDPHLVSAAAVVLGSALCASSTLLLAALGQQIKPQSIAMAQSLQTFSMNAPPSQIILEFDREMQRGWTEKIPNRAYMRITPETTGDSGAFEGHVIEETQPVPQDIEPLGLLRCLELPAYRWLVMLDVLALIGAAVGSLLLLNFAHAFAEYWALVMGLALLLVARFAFAGGNRLWRRFEFISRIYWLECHGNFQRAKTSIGAMLQDRVKTEKDLVNVEDMTLRLWVAEVESVCFGPDTPRSLMSIRGLQDEAQRLADRLAQFATQQASIIAPQADGDLQRLAVLNRINPALAAAPAAAALLGATPAPPPSSPAPRQFCPSCGGKLEANARFCSHCGARLTEPAGN